MSRAAGVDPASFPGIAWTSYVAAVVTSGIFTVDRRALRLLAVAALGRHHAAPRCLRRRAYGVATPAWAYATLFMGHGQTAGLPDDRAGRSRPSLGEGACACASEAGLDHRPRRRLGGGDRVPGGDPGDLHRPAGDRSREGCARSASSAPVILRIAAGVALAAVPLFVYNTLAFGSPFHLGYASEEGFKELQTGFFGITYPSLWTIRELLFGSYRGLLPLSPLMAAVPIGLALLGRKGRAGPALVAGGDRRLLPAAERVLLLLGRRLGVRAASDDAGAAVPGARPGAAVGSGTPAGRGLLLAGWIWGAAVTLVGVSTTPQPPASFKAPMRELLWPAFRDGDLSLNTADLRAQQRRRRAPARRRRSARRMEPRRARRPARPVRACCRSSASGSSRAPSCCCCCDRAAPSRRSAAVRQRRGEPAFSRGGRRA